MLHKGRTNRTSSYELLRILAMLMIVSHHYAVHGIKHFLVGGGGHLKLDWLSGSLVNRVFTNFLVPGGQIGVGLFFVLTGYFMINKTIKVEKIARLSVTVALYSILLCVLYFALRAFHMYSFEDYTKFSSVELAINALLPISSNSWWFVTAYVILYLCIPQINAVLLKMNRVGFLFLLMFMWVFWYSSSALGFTYCYLQKALFFYSVGSYLKLHSSTKANSTHLLLFILAWICFALSECVRFFYFGGNGAFRAFFGLLETSIFTPFAVVCLVVYFGGINIGDRKWINRISETTFGVYVIHDSAVGRTLIWDGLAKNCEQYLSTYYPFYALITILLVFSICSAIDLLRMMLVDEMIGNGIAKIRLFMQKSEA